MKIQKLISKAKSKYFFQKEPLKNVEFSKLSADSVELSKKSFFSKNLELQLNYPKLQSVSCAFEDLKTLRDKTEIDFLQEVFAETDYDIFDKPWKIFQQSYRVKNKKIEEDIVLSEVFFSGIISTDTQRTNLKNLADVVYEPSLNVDIDSWQKEKVDFTSKNFPKVRVLKSWAGFDEIKIFDYYLNIKSFEKFYYNNHPTPRTTMNLIVINPFRNNKAICAVCNYP